ncbi:helix-turn-helix transcriptional regulator [bacterium]|nr:helix-turn-helix transcriptional regulator [bacterium]
MDPHVEPWPRAASVWEPLAIVPRQPARAGENRIPRGTDLPAEAFNDFDLWMPLEGRSTVHLLGRTERLDAGTCLLLPPRVGVTQRVAADTDHHIAFFHFDIAYRGHILREARRYVKESPNGSLMLALPGLPALALLAPLDTARLADRLLRAARWWDDVAQLQSQSLVMGALAQHRREAVRPTGGRGRGGSVVDAALAYLEENLSRPVFVAEVARHVRLSPTHLTRLFRVELQETPMQALIRMRLMRAHNLLRDPTLNIGEVAAACGFESLSYFTRVFSRAYGGAPTSYRRRLQHPR